MKKEEYRSVVTCALMRLPNFSTIDLCEIYSKLERREWDERLGRSPKGFYKMKSYRYEEDNNEGNMTKFDIVNPIMEAIKAIVGHKEVLRYQNVIKYKIRTDEEFETWWRYRLIEETTGFEMYDEIPD